MNRPTTRDLDDATDDLHLIIYGHDPNGSPRRNTAFPAVKKLLNMRAWLITEIAMAERAAAYGPGVKDGYHTLQHGAAASDLSDKLARDAKANDPYARALRNLLSAWNLEDDRIAAERMQEAMDVGRYPTRSEQADPHVQLG